MTKEKPTGKNVKDRKPKRNVVQEPDELKLLLRVANLLPKISARESLFEGSHLQEAAAAFKSKAGGSIKAVTLEITADTATLSAQGPNQPEHVDEYVYSKGSL